MDRILVVSTRSNEPSLIVVEDAGVATSNIYCIGLRVVGKTDGIGYTIQPRVNRVSPDDISNIIQTNNRITCYNLERRTDRCQILKRIAGSILYNQKLNLDEVWVMFVSLFRYQDDVTEFFTYTKEWLWLVNYSYHFAEFQEAFE